jgi:hypothetical protein
MFLPMFEIGLNSVKEEIQRRIDALLHRVFQDYEAICQVAGKALIEKYKKIKERFDQNLSTPAEFIEMENYKAGLMTVMGQIRTETQAFQEQIFFLMRADCVTGP